jgi:hypothetical protein
MTVLLPPLFPVVQINNSNGNKKTNNGITVELDVEL